MIVLTENVVTEGSNPVLELCIISDEVVIVSKEGVWCTNSVGELSVCVVSDGLTSNNVELVTASVESSCSAPNG